MRSCKICGLAKKVHTIEGGKIVEKRPKQDKKREAKNRNDKIVSKIKMDDEIFWTSTMKRKEKDK